MDRTTGCNVIAKDVTTYEECIEEMYHLDKCSDLTKLNRICEAYEFPQNKFKVVHVAGTNGKGSVCTKIANYLEGRGYTVGIYTSPHIWSYCERIKIKKEQISCEDVVKYYVDIANKCREFNISLTFFQVATLMAFLYFVEKKVTWVVLETGLGGRLDATNAVLNPSVTVISSIGWDHMDILGDTLDNIAGEKAGIFKPRCPVVLGGKSHIYPSIWEQARKLETPVYVTQQNLETWLELHEKKRLNGDNCDNLDFNMGPSAKIDQRRIDELLQDRNCNKIECDETTTFNIENTATAAEAIWQLGFQIKIEEMKNLLLSKPLFRCFDLNEFLLSEASNELRALAIKNSPSIPILKSEGIYSMSPPGVVIDVGHNRTALQRVFNELRRKYGKLNSTTAGAMNDSHDSGYRLPVRVCAAGSGSASRGVKLFCDMLSAAETANVSIKGLHIFCTDHPRLIKIEDCLSQITEMLRNEQCDTSSYPIGWWKTMLRSFNDLIEMWKKNDNVEQDDTAIQMPKSTKREKLLASLSELHDTINKLGQNEKDGGTTNCHHEMNISQVDNEWNCLMQGITKEKGSFSVDSFAPLVRVWEASIGFPLVWQLATQEKSILLICGSFYLIGDIISLLGVPSDSF